jgi:hypothetical protein
MSLARILVSNTGIIKFQHLFPVIRTAFMHHVKSCNISALLGELSPRKVLCPGLPDYLSHHSTLGYHPKELRVIHTQTPDYRRFDHRECPMFHIPESNLRWKRHFPDNMCTKCIQLHSFILRLLEKMPLPAAPPQKKCSRYTTGTSLVENGGLSSSASEVESPPHGSSFPDPHSVPAVSEETTTPLSTSVATPVATTTPVTVTTAEDTSNSSVLATYYRESLGQRFISTLSTSPSSSSPSLPPPSLPSSSL